MQVFQKRLLLLFLLSFSFVFSLAQQNDSSFLVKKSNSIKSFSTRTPIIHSAILPGWGQINNRKYWKLPLVYGALGTTAYLFNRNIKTYRDAKNAYALAVDGDPTNDYLIKQPYYTVKEQPERIRTFRNQVRQDIDYCVLFFVFFWGLNVADAAVDAHLKTFDVSENLSMNIKPGFSPLANTNGLSFVFQIK